MSTALRNGLFFALVIGIEIITVSWAVIRSGRYKSTQILAPRMILIGGTFLTAVVLFFGLEILEDFEHAGLTKLFGAICNAMQIFVVNMDLGEYLSGMSGGVTQDALTGLADNPVFTGFVGLLFVFAPCLTFEFLLSLFGDAHSNIRVMLSKFRDKCVFSDLNEKSIALAESIFESDQSQKKSKPRMIIFSNVSKIQNNAGEALLERARAIHAICFKKDISAVNCHSTVGNLMFFVIGEESADNVKIATWIKDAFKNRNRTTVYIFSSSIEAELFAGTQINEAIAIRCVNEARSLVYRTLYDMETSRIENGTPDLFSEAVPDDSGKIISVVIAGLGDYGEEMLRALTWFCQMDGYTIKINAFDKDPSAEDRFYEKYPALLERSGAGDKRYDITIHAGVDVESLEFVETIRTLNDTSYVFVSLGTDKQNISTSVLLRRIFEQIGIHPSIQAVVHHSDKARLLEGRKNFRGDAYDIWGVGDDKKQYSEKVVINSELEEEALAIHKRYGKPADYESRSDAEKERINTELEKSFFSYEYNYRSSMASALHLKARIACGLQGPGVTENVDQLSRLENRRWGAYMRTEGYRFSGSTNPKSRNDLGKLHHLLIPFDDLPEVEKEKDRRMAL